MEDCDQCLEDMGWSGVTCEMLKKYNYCGEYSIIQQYCPVSCPEARAAADKEYEEYLAERDEAEKDPETTYADDDVGDGTIFPEGGSNCGGGDFTFEGNMEKDFGVMEQEVWCAQNNLRQDPDSFLPLMRAFRNGFP